MLRIPSGFCTVHKIQQKIVWLLSIITNQNSPINFIHNWQSDYDVLVTSVITCTAASASLAVGIM